MLKQITSRNPLSLDNALEDKKVRIRQMSRSRRNPLSLDNALEEGKEAKAQDKIISSQSAFAGQCFGR